MSKIRVLLCDDHPMIINGLRSVLDLDTQFEVIGTADNGEAAAKMIEALKPDVAVIDISMAGMTGIDLLRWLKETRTPCNVLIFTMHEEAAHVHETLRNGARGFILKHSSKSLILTAIRTVAQGEMYLGPHAAAVLARAIESAGAPGQDDDVARRASELTAREKNIIRLIGEGLSSQEIGDKLFISRRTVDTHRSNILRKLGLKNSSALMRFALNLFPPA